MRPRHRALLDPACEAVAHDQVVTEPQTLEDWRNLTEVVALVGVAHDDEATRRCRDTAPNRRAVSGFIDGDDLGSVGEGNLLRTIGAAVVRNQDLRAEIQLRDRSTGTVDTFADGLGLVQARHQDREFEKTL